MLTAQNVMLGYTRVPWSSNPSCRDVFLSSYLSTARSACHKNRAIIEMTPSDLKNNLNALANMSSNLLRRIHKQKYNVPLKHVNIEVDSVILTTIQSALYDSKIYFVSLLSFMNWNKWVSFEDNILSCSYHQACIEVK